MAKLRSDHHWYITNLQFICIYQGFFMNYGSDSGCWIFFAIFFLFNFDLTINFSLIVKTSHSCFMWPNNFVRAITFMLMGISIDGAIAKNDFVSCLFVICSIILSLFLNCGYSALLNDFLNWIHQKTLKGKNLLSYKSILLEVTINNLPTIVLINWI